MTTATKKGKGAMLQQELIRLLLIDDEADHWAGMFDQGLKPYGFDLSIETHADHAVSAIREHHPNVILLDLHFPDDDQRTDGHTTGGVLLSKIRQDFSNIPVVVFTTRLADVDIPLEIFDRQPHGFFGKNQIAEMQDAHNDWAPILAQALYQAIDVADIEQRSPEEDMGFVVGSTTAMQGVASLVRSAAKNSLTVLIYGESGTGKQGVAEAIHRLGKRKGRLEHVNCSGINEETLTAQLFGHEKGAYTGAVGEKPGLFELAHEGTLFLDEIQAMPSSLQNNLMTAIEKNTVRRMGGVKDIPVQVRLIVATNKPISELVADNVLREDLAYRLNRFPISLPPLRERKQDLPILWKHIIAKANEKLHRNVTDVFRPEVQTMLEAYDWPGNIRELESVIEYAVATSPSNTLFPSDIVIKPLLGKNQNTLISCIETRQQNVAGVVDTYDSASDAQSITMKIDGMAVEERYAYLTGYRHPEIRKQVLIEIVKLLRQRQSKKVQHKDLADYLDIITEPKKDYERIRQMVVTSGVQLTKLDCNQ
jgi:two-component system, NtrC family, response regulator AtoC